MTGAERAVELLRSALMVIDAAFSKKANAQHIAPMFSGGHDSLCACFVASRHSRFAGTVHHINTGIGSKLTRAFVDTVCRDFAWELKVYKSKVSYEDVVRQWGFPGPGGHGLAYARLKDRCVYAITKQFRKRVALITGCRQQESTRRMGNVVSMVTIGETSKKTGKTRNKKRIWTNPCYDWSSQDQRNFMDHFDLPRNPVKMSPLSMSGECFCGAFARPDEISMIRCYAPDVAEEIDRLTEIAKAHGQPSVWGTRPDKKSGVVVAQTGPLCNSCDYRARQAGVMFEEIEVS